MIVFAASAERTGERRKAFNVWGLSDWDVTFIIMANVLQFVFFYELKDNMGFHVSHPAGSKRIRIK